MSFLSDHPKGTILRLHIVPRASRTCFVGLYGDPPRLKLKLCAPPVDGKANESLVEFLAKALGKRKDEIQLIRGEKTSKKDVLILEISLQDLHSRLNRLLNADMR